HTALRAMVRVRPITIAPRRPKGSFPLTPALSLGERENPPLPFSTTQRGVCPTNLPNNRTCRRLFPLLVGEGQSEGNRVAVRYKSAYLRKIFGAHCRFLSPRGTRGRGPRRGFQMKTRPLSPALSSIRWRRGVSLRLRLRRPAK